MINYLKKSGEWKMHLKMKMNSMSYKNSDEKCQEHSKSKNGKIMTGFGKEELFQEFFELLLPRCQVGLEQSMKGIEIVL